MVLAPVIFATSPLNSFGFFCFQLHEDLRRQFKETSVSKRQRCAARSSRFASLRQSCSTVPRRNVADILSALVLQSRWQTDNRPGWHSRNEWRKQQSDAHDVRLHAIRSEDVTEKSKKPPGNFLNFSFPFSPAIVLPSPDQFTIAARCCPLLFKLRDHDESTPPIIDLPYRMVFAIATKSSVCLYDTQQRMPFGLISNIHYARLTDLAWSSDGTVLVVSSSDGFCTLITFAVGELGTIYAESDQPMDVEETEESTPATGTVDPANDSTAIGSEPKATPIAFRHKPRVATELASKFNITPTKDKILEIPSNIIEIDDKFEDSEPKNKVATPISVRRQPRCAAGNDSPNVQDDKRPPSSKKQPTPIAVRRQPRVILQSGPPSATAQDDALDAWPIDQPKPVSQCDASAEDRAELITTKCSDVVDLTEDIRLVYDDSSMDSSMGDEVKVTPNSKTTRRVELRTISTPKSNKKLF